MRAIPLILLASSAAALVAQNPAADSSQTPSFRLQTNVVQIPVSVTDEHGKAVEDLGATDFTVLDDGVRRTVSLDRFDTGVAPISLAVAIQSSGISTPALAKIRGIGGMIQPLVTGSRGAAAVLSFDREIKWLSDFTVDSTAIQSAVAKVEPAGMMDAHLFDAVLEVAEQMKKRDGRKVLLIISESRDRGSKASFGQAMEALQRQSIEVFGAHYSAYSTTFIARPEDVPPPTDSNLFRIFTELGRLAKTNSIEALTQTTGGSDFPFTKERGLEKSIEKFGTEVHSQYILTFPQNAEPGSVNHPGLHFLEVSVPGRPRLRLRYRRNYFF